nr:carbohydrate kinase family protein [Candidatus Sigynarchaeota archaeon]
MKDIDLACIGSCCVDIIMNVLDVFRFEMIDSHAPDIIKKYTAIEYSSKLNVKSVKVAPGGSAANVSSNLGNLGMKTSYIGKLGDDTLARIAIDDLVGSHVNVDPVILTKDDSTAVSVILITPFGKDRSILAYKGANNLIQPSDIKDEWLDRAKHLQWTSLTSDSAVKSIEKCVDRVKASGGYIFACPSISIIKNNTAAAINLIKKSDLLTLNKEELFALTNETSVISAMKIVLQMGPKIVACTDGGSGSYISDGKVLLKAGVYPVDVQDTTGAGDAFASGLIYSYMHGLSMEQMVKYGSAISAFECSVLGVRDGIPRDMKIIEDYIATKPLSITSSPFVPI